MRTLLSIGFTAALFALYAWLRPRQCTGRCAGCTGATCKTFGDHHAH